MRRLTAVAATLATASTLALGGAAAANAAVGPLFFHHWNGATTPVFDPPAGCYSIPEGSESVLNHTSSPVGLSVLPCDGPQLGPTVYPGDGANTEQFVSYRVHF